MFFCHCNLDKYNFAWHRTKKLITVQLHSFQISRMVGEDLGFSNNSVPDLTTTQVPYQADVKLVSETIFYKKKIKKIKKSCIHEILNLLLCADSSGNTNNSGVRCHMSGVRCQVSRVRCLVTHVMCWVSPAVKCQ